MAVRARAAGRGDGAYMSTSGDAWETCANGGAVKAQMRVHKDVSVCCICRELCLPACGLPLAVRGGVSLLSCATSSELSDGPWSMCLDMLKHCAEPMQHLKQRLCCFERTNKQQFFYLMGQMRLCQGGCSCARY